MQGADSRFGLELRLPFGFRFEFGFDEKKDSFAAALFHF